MNKLQGKDLINVGIFTAIYFVVMMAIAMLGFIPIFLPLLIVLVPLIGGIVMMLYYSKVQKFGMVSLTGLICGILMLLTGMGYWSIITGAVFGVLADLVLKSGDYKSAKKGIISHGVFSMWIIGNYIPIVATRDSYYQQLISGYGQEYADSIMSYISAYTLPILLKIDNRSLPRFFREQQDQWNSSQNRSKLFRSSPTSAAQDKEGNRNKQCQLCPRV